MIDVNSVASFHQTLFTSEIAVFGVLAATLFVFVQIIYGYFSYRHIGIIMKSPSLVAYLILSSATIIITGIAALSLSFPKEQINSYNYKFSFQDFFASESLATILLVAFFFSLLLFIMYTFFGVLYLRPHELAKLLQKSIKNKKLRDYLLKRYGISSYESIVPLIYKLSEKEGEEFNEEENLRQLNKNKRIYEKTSRRVQNAKDPLEMINALILRAINNKDVTSLGEISHVIKNISKNFIKKYEDHSNVNVDGNWSPDQGVRTKFLEHLIDLLRNYMEMSERENLETAKIIFLEISNEVLKELMPHKRENEIEIILDFWKEVGDAAINKSSRVFKKVISLYKLLADIAFETEKNSMEKHERWLEAVFRQVGWLAERLFSKKQLEQKPIIWDTTYSDEFDSIINAIWSYSHRYSFSYPNTYPLIYFDVVYVVFLRLVQEYKKQKLQNLKNLLFDCTYTYSSFAVEAIKKGNSNGAALAAMRMKENYEELIKNDLKEVAKDTICLFVDVAVHAASHAKGLSRVDFMSEKIDDYLIKIIERSSFDHEIRKEMFEAYIKVPGDSDLKWDFITKLGMRMRTNFGFNFDENTGKKYADNDLRKR